MKAVRYEETGIPEDVVACVEMPDPGAPGPGEIVADIEAFPINPADIHQLTGASAVGAPELGPLGAEGVGRIAAIGPGVDDLAVGDRVLFLSRNNWTSRRRVPAQEAIRLPNAFQGDISDDLILQAAMMKVNPATAYGLLKRFADLKHGDWIVQDVANSAVGLCVVRLAKNAGIRTVNVIRSDAAAAKVKKAGGDVTMQDGDDLGERIRAAAGGPVTLAIDAVAGSICDRLADGLAPGKTLVSYGRMSGEPCQITSRHLIYGEITLTGFWLGTMLREMNRAEVTALYADLGRQVTAGDLASPVEATYPIDEIKAAVAHARREGRSGKVLVRPEST